MIRLILIEDHTILRESFSLLLTSSGKFDVVATSSKASEALRLVDEHKPDVVLMDVYTEDGNGIDATSAIKSKYPDIKVYLLTGMKEIHLIKRAQEVGADGYLYKDIHPESLINMITSSMDNYKIFPNTFQGESEDGEENYDFSYLEVEMLQYLCCGFSLEQIGDKLGYSPNTIKAYISKLLTKSGFVNRSQLLAYVTKKGYIDPELIFDENMDPINNNKKPQE